MFETIGDIQSVTKDGLVTITTRIDKPYLLELQEINQVNICARDNRLMTKAQRGAIFATLNDICEWNGYEIEEMETFFKVELIKYTGCDYFTFSSKPKADRLPCDVTTARLYLRLLINFCLRWDVPTKESLLNRAEDTGRYLYACLIHKKCCLCQLHADIHHADAVGSAYRATTEHIGKELMSLCRIHHDEFHRMGKSAFNERYHVFGIKCDKTIAEKHNLLRKG